MVLDNRKEPEKMLCLLINHNIPETINMYYSIYEINTKIISGFQKLLKNHNNDNSIIVVQPTVAKVDDGKNAILFLLKLIKQILVQVVSCLVDQEHGTVRV